MTTLTVTAEPAHRPLAQRIKDAVSGGAFRQYGMLIALGLLVVLFQILTNWLFLHPRNVTSLLVQNGYVLILAMPLSGWLYDSASGLRPFRWFGLAEVPKLSPPHEALADAMHETHELLFWVLIALVIGHAGAALYHHFVRRDATLARMLPRRWRAGSVVPTAAPSPDLPPEDPR